MFSAPHSLLRRRGQRKPKVGINAELEALLPGVPPVETTARAMAVLGYACTQPNPKSRERRGIYMEREMFRSFAASAVAGLCLVPQVFFSSGY
jgi:hypothetical protein